MTQPGDPADHERAPDAVDALLARQDTFADLANVTASTLSSIPAEDHGPYLRELYASSTSFVFLWRKPNGKDVIFGAKVTGVEKIACMRVQSFAEAESLADTLAGRKPSVTH